MGDILLGFALFLITALDDMLSVWWWDSLTPTRRALISAIHEAMGFAAGFTVYALTQNFWMILPCVAGAWVGSYIVNKNTPVELDPDMLQAVHDAVELVLDERFPNDKMR